MTDKSPNHNHLLCLGLGYTAGYTAKAMLEKRWLVSGTTRSSGKAEKLDKKGIKPLIWDAAKGIPDTDFSNVTEILVSTAPDTNGCPSLEMIKKVKSRMTALRSVIYYSSTGVCGDHGGDWIDEDTEPVSTLTRGRQRLKAEKQWRTFSEEQRIAVTILRLSGIYGPGRNALVTLQRQGDDARRVFKPGQVFNRIHVEDIAAITRLILERSATNCLPAHNLYNLADDEPAPPQDVIEYAAQLSDREKPPLVSLEDANLSDMARSFYAENKRIRNDRLKQDLGYKFLYPNWREGLKALAASSST